VWPGDPITYTIIAANGGSADAADVSITDTLPTGISGTGLNWAGVLTAGETLTFTLPAQVMTETTFMEQSLTNTAWLSHTSAQLSADAIVTVASRPLTPSLTLTKTVAAARTPVWPGDPITYTIIAANGGSADAADVSITDTLPAGLIGAGLDWTGVLMAGETLSFTLPAQVMSATIFMGQSLTNTAYLSHTTVQLSAAAAVTIRGGYAIYLPVVRR
jgi:uncharacterized repeat protein (TIGR01451 family)